MRLMFVCLGTATATCRVNDGDGDFSFFPDQPGCPRADGPTKPLDRPLSRLWRVRVSAANLTIAKMASQMPPSFFSLRLYLVSFSLEA